MVRTKPAKTMTIFSRKKEPEGSDDNIAPDEVSFLKYVADHPEVSLCRVAPSLGLGSNRAARIGVPCRNVVGF